MTKSELIKAMENMGDDDVVIICESIKDGKPIGWSNIERVQKTGSSISISLDKYYGDG